MRRLTVAAAVWVHCPLSDAEPSLRRLWRLRGGDEAEALGLLRRLRNTCLDCGRIELERLRVSLQKRRRCRRQRMHAFLRPSDSLAKPHASLVKSCQLCCDIRSRLINSPVVSGRADMGLHRLEVISIGKPRILGAEPLDLQVLGLGGADEGIQRRDAFM